VRFWGITGTNGKTTTAWIFAAFVDAWGASRRARKRASEAEEADGRDPLCGYITTVEAFDGARRFYTGYTTPPLAQLREIYASMEANGCTDCVMEVSSHAIHQDRVGFGDVTTFSGGAFTNLTEDHLDYHKTMEEYFRVKRSFAERIAAGRPGAPYVVCLDGGCGREMLEACRKLALKVVAVTAGTDGTGGMTPEYDLSWLQLAGSYNKSNVLVAAALAEVAGVPRDIIQATIPTLKPRWGRLELVENPCVKAKAYVDFAHTPDGLEKVLSAARGFTPRGGRLWVVFGAGGDRDPMKRPLMGAACARLADRLVVTSDNPRSEDPMKIIGQVVAGAEGAKELHVEPDRRKAIEFALAEAGADDVVIIAGKGHETTQEIKGVKHPFDDREVVRAFAAKG
jgi:UDP-N-acetylmuramoyl-L-alanyl-D-glutamate--2,6-diaminopimelate ligase